MTEPIRAFISAPAGADLGALPTALEAHNLDWEWAKSADAVRISPPDAIQQADVFVGVLTGVREDRRVLLEIGIAAGLRKKILVLRTSAKVWPSDVPGIKSARLNLNNYQALNLHIEALLGSPQDSIFQRGVHGDVKPSSLIPEQRAVERGQSYEAQIAARLADVIARAGGAVVHEPQDHPGAAKFRPDMLIWLGNQEPELLDPAAVEIRRKLDPSKLRTLEDRLITFMNATGVRSSIVVSDSEFVPQLRFRWPTIFALHTDQFEQLVERGALGRFLREERNKAMHAAS